MPQRGKDLIPSGTLLETITYIQTEFETLKTYAEFMDLEVRAKIASDQLDIEKRLVEANEQIDAFDQIYQEAHRAAIILIAKIKVKIVREYDAAKERGEVAKAHRPRKSDDTVTQEDLSLDSRRLSENRYLSNFDKDNPGKLEHRLRTADAPHVEVYAIIEEERRKDNPKPKPKLSADLQARMFIKKAETFKADLAKFIRDKQDVGDQVRPLLWQVLRDIADQCYSAAETFKVLEPAE
jgi:hypothetical protein